MMTMTQKERVQAQVAHQETDYIPYELLFDEGIDEELDRLLGSSDWRPLLDNAVLRLPEVMPSLLPGEPVTSGSLFFTDAYGSVWQVDRRPWHLVKPVLAEPSLQGYHWPEVDSLFKLNWREETMATIEADKDHFLLIRLSLGVHDRYWAMRGFEDFLVDAASDPAFFGELLGGIAEHQMQMLERMVGLPVDGIMFADDWGYQNGVLLGPERWRRYIKPLLAPMYARVHAAGKVVATHCCGSVADVIPDLIEIGLDVLQSVQPEPVRMNPYELKRRFGAHLTFWGGLGSQSTIQFGTPAEIKDEVEKLCREMGKGGGYILGPAKALQPGMPLPNAVAVLEAFLEQSGASLPQPASGKTQKQLSRDQD